MAAVETAFAKKTISAEEAGGGLKALKRKEARKEKFKKELIKVLLLNEKGEEEEACTWKVQRAKITPKGIQELINRCPRPGIVSYLRERQSSDIIYLEDAQKSCKAKPFEYLVVLRIEREPMDMAGDPHYDGQLQIVLYDVPQYDDSGENKLMPLDVREWLMFGVQEEDGGVQDEVANVARLKKECERAGKDMKGVAYLELQTPGGAKLKGAAADAEREYKYQELQAKKDELEQRLEEAKKHLDETIHKRDGTEVVLTPAELHDHNKTTTWYVSIKGKEAKELEEMLASKTDWDGVKLALAHKGPEGELPPWAGRGAVPDGSKPYIPNYTGVAVNMNAVRVCRIEHGFGTLKVSTSQTVPFIGPAFEYYHGEFKEGRKDGAGVEYSDHGIFSGYFSKGSKRGRGRWDEARGDTYVGEFATPLRHHDTVLPEGNPYALGVAHGDGARTFADSAHYAGEFLNGRVTGEGVYTNAMGETFDGNFVEGLLDGKAKMSSVLGEAYDGNWERGEYHGEGKLKSRRGDSYDGAWHRGERHGKGFERYSNANQFRGYYSRDARCGHGVTVYGNVKEKLDTSTGRLEVEFNCLHEGGWLGGFMRAKGVNTFVRTGMRYFTFNKRSKLYPFLSGLKEDEELYRSKQARSHARHLALDEALREQIERKKFKLFRQQRHHAKRALVEDFRSTLKLSEYDSRVDLRKMRLDALVDKGKVTQDQINMIHALSKQPPLGAGDDARPLEAAQRVTARKDRGDFWHGARVTAVYHEANVYDLLFDERLGAERRVERHYIVHRFEKRDRVELLPVKEVSAVEAAKGADTADDRTSRWVPGSVRAVHQMPNGERSYDIHLDETNTDEGHVPAHRLRPAKERSLGVAAAQVEHIITERNPEADSYVLSKVLRCDFEEMEERRKVINYERLLRKAQAKTESNDK